MWPRPSGSSCRRISPPPRTRRQPERVDDALAPARLDAAAGAGGVRRARVTVVGRASRGRADRAAAADVASWTRLGGRRRSRWPAARAAARRPAPGPRHGRRRRRRGPRPARSVDAWRSGRAEVERRAASLAAAAEWLCRDADSAIERRVDAPRRRRSRVRRSVGTRAHDGRVVGRGLRRRDRAGAASTLGARRRGRRSWARAVLRRRASERRARAAAASVGSLRRPRVLARSAAAPAAAVAASSPSALPRPRAVAADPVADRLGRGRAARRARGTVVGTRVAAVAGVRRDRRVRRRRRAPPRARLRGSTPLVSSPSSASAGAPSSVGVAGLDASVASTSPPAAERRLQRRREGRSSVAFSPPQQQRHSGSASPPAALPCRSAVPVTRVRCMCERRRAMRMPRPKPASARRVPRRAAEEIDRRAGRFCRARRPPMRAIEPPSPPVTPGAMRRCHSSVSAPRARGSLLALARAAARPRPRCCRRPARPRSLSPWSSSRIGDRPRAPPQRSRRRRSRGSRRRPPRGRRPRHRRQRPRPFARHRRALRRRGGVGLALRRDRHERRPRDERCRAPVTLEVDRPRARGRRRAAPRASARPTSVPPVAAQRLLLNEAPADLAARAALARHHGRRRRHAAHPRARDRDQPRGDDAAGARRPPASERRRPRRRRLGRRSTLVDFNRRHPRNRGPLPSLATNPVVAGVRDRGRRRPTPSGDWLLDTGAACTMISTATARRARPRRRERQAVAPPRLHAPDRRHRRRPRNRCPASASTASTLATDGRPHARLPRPRRRRARHQHRPRRRHARSRSTASSA